jgi:hypothetical protein
MPYNYKKELLPGYLKFPSKKRGIKKIFGNYFRYF